MMRMRNLAAVVALAAILNVGPYLGVTAARDAVPLSLADALERAFVGEFSDTEAARALWRREARPSVELIENEIYPKVDPDVCATAAIAAMRAKRAADPNTSMESLMATALSPDGEGIRILKVDAPRQGISKEVGKNAARPTSEVELTTVKGVAVLRISSVKETTADAVQSALKSAPARLVIDLRGNTGGLLQEIARVASCFFADGVVVLRLETRDDTGSAKTFPPYGDCAKKSDLIVLIDGATNSGGLALAAALATEGRAKIAGTLTERPSGKISGMRQVLPRSGVVYPIGLIRRADDRPLADGVAIDIPIAESGDAAIEKAIKAFSGR